jgi:hypothetical protein
MTQDKRDNRRNTMFEDDHDRMKLIFDAERYFEEYDREDVPAVFNQYIKDKKKIEFPAIYIVCYVCEGRGKYVHPDIDRNGLDPNEMDEEFCEAYWDGQFDMTCKYCAGKRVVLEIDTNHHSVDKQLLERMLEEQKFRLNSYNEMMDEIQAEQRAFGYLSTGAVEVTERKIAARNESEIDPKYLDMEVGHRKTLSQSLDNDIVFSVVRIK